MQKFGLLQLNDPDEESLLRMHRAASTQLPRFVVWPEFAGIVFTSRANTHRLQAISLQTAPVVTSFQDDFAPLPHNVAALFSQGRQIGAYNKRKLFGGESKMHSPGTQPAAVDYGGGLLGLNICFDSCYPAVIRETASLPGVNVIALPSIDPYGSNNFIAAMHGAYTPFRAAENGVAIIKCDGMAYSQAVDASGQILAELSPGNQVKVIAVPTERRKTLYSLMGDWVLWLLGLAVSLRFGVEIWRQRRNRDGEHNR